MSTCRGLRQSGPWNRGGGVVKSPHPPKKCVCVCVGGGGGGGGVLTKLFCTSGPNLLILAWMGGELWRGETQNGVNLVFQVKFDLEGQGRSVHKLIGTLTKVFWHLWSNFGEPSLNGSRVIARTNKWLTHRQTYTQTQATTIPEGQNWPRGKTNQLTVYRICN